MALSEFEIKRYEKIMGYFLEKHRPPLHIRAEVDLSYRLTGQSIVIFEIRAEMRETSKKIKINIAKATYVKTTKNWKVYWHKSDMKWHSYTPCPEVATLEEFGQLVGEDKHCCFFG